jgi:hypothetical protein
VGGAYSFLRHKKNILKKLSPCPGYGGLWVCRGRREFFFSFEILDKPASHASPSSRPSKKKKEEVDKIAPLVLRNFFKSYTPPFFAP